MYGPWIIAVSSSWAYACVVSIGVLAKTLARIHGWMLALVDVCRLSNKCIESTLINSKVEFTKRVREDELEKRKLVWGGARTLTLTPIV